MGLTLKAVTDAEGLYVTYDRRLHSFKENDGGDWIQDKAGGRIRRVGRRQISGIYIDVLRALEADMNFTTELYIRQDEVWGVPTKKQGWTGLMGNILRGDADFICAPVMENAIRARFVYSLHALSKITGAIYVSRQGLEEHAWLSFLYPLRGQVWSVLLVNACLLLVAVKGLQLIHRGGAIFWSSRTTFSILEDVVGDFWMLGASYFGRKANTTDTRESGPLRILLFAAFFSGTLVFMAYKSSLTAELAVSRNSLPFETLEQLYHSDIK